MRTLLNELKEELLQVFDHLHENAEVSWEEIQTTEYLSNLLSAYGLNPIPFDGCTGFIAEIGEGPYCVGLRTDMDALWQEVDGVFKANHSCGHDAHMTMIVGTILLLKKLDFQPKGKLKFIFQPAEEKGTGALKLIEKGVVDDIDYLYGVHLRPKEEVPLGKCSSGIINGAARFVSGEIIGEDAHGARPHQGNNSIEIGATLVNEFSKIHLNPMVPYSVKMTTFHAGAQSKNVIPGHATFDLDLRAQTNEVMDQLNDAVYKITDAAAAINGVKIVLKTEAQIAAAQIHPDAQRLMEQAIVQTIGAENLVQPYMSAGGEDFHFYTIKRPKIKATMLGLGCDLSPGLHHPKMTFDKEALFTGIEILAKTMINTCEVIELNDKSIITS
ncbi:MAG TPA: amidohydrolase [Bacillus bacterium]|nr:amidohydrolase [Bacillus sp. (in: firmicutes)]